MKHRIPLHTELFPNVSAQRVLLLMASAVFMAETNLLFRLKSLDLRGHRLDGWSATIISLARHRRSQGFAEAEHRVARMVHAGLAKLDHSN